MPIGGWETQGMAGWSTYRCFLDGMLHDAGVAFDFVGRSSKPFAGDTYGCPFAFDTDSEASHDYSASHVISSVTPVVEELQPDVVLITLGLDDMIKGVEPGDAAAGLESFITSLQAVNPDLTIFVAQIGPCNVPDTECVDAVPAFNDAIASFSDLSTDESLVFVVDMVTDFSLDGLRDGGWGMNDAGDEAVARRWMDALQETGVF